MQGKSTQVATLKDSLNKKFEIGEVVEIIGGLMARMSKTASPPVGTIKRISRDGKTLTLIVRMFSQDTEAIINAVHVRKII